jgi:hypothetical protein
MSRITSTIGAITTIGIGIIGTMTGAGAGIPGATGNQQY